MTGVREFDVDPWTFEVCAPCGHRRYDHTGGAGACRFTVQRSVPPENLPAPTYDHPGDPFVGPNNWPPVADWPVVTVPCCSEFDDERYQDGE